MFVLSLCLNYICVITMSVFRIFVVELRLIMLEQLVCAMVNLEVICG